MILAGYFTGNIKHKKCSSELSSTWGCYKPVSRPRWNMPCYLCVGVAGDVSCPLCHGHGKIGMNRCPVHSNTGTVDRVFTFYSELVNHKVLPVVGGMLDQATGFVKVASIMSSFEGAWKAQKEANDEAKRNLKNGRQ